LEVWKRRKDRGEYKVECVKCGRNDMIRGRKLEEGKILCPEYRTGKKKLCVTNFIQSYLHQFFDDSHGLKASLKPLRRPFD